MYVTPKKMLGAGPNLDNLKLKITLSPESPEKRHSRNYGSAVNFNHIMLNSSGLQDTVA